MRRGVAPPRAPPSRARFEWKGSGLIHTWFAPIHNHTGTSVCIGRTNDSSCPAQLAKGYTPPICWNKAPICRRSGAARRAHSDLPASLRASPSKWPLSFARSAGHSRCARLTAAGQPSVAPPQAVKNRRSGQRKPLVPNGFEPLYTLGDEPFYLGLTLSRSNSADLG